MIDLVCTNMLRSLVLIAFLTGNTALAQEQPATASSSPVETKAQDDKTVNQPQADPSGQKNTAREKGDEVFKPSEEISEDFAVSFPVDI